VVDTTMVYFKVAIVENGQFVSSTISVSAGGLVYNIGDSVKSKIAGSPIFVFDRVDFAWDFAKVLQLGGDWPVILYGFGSKFMSEVPGVLPVYHASCLENLERFWRGEFDREVLEVNRMITDSLAGSAFLYWFRVTGLINWNLSDYVFDKMGVEHAWLQPMTRFWAGFDFSLDEDWMNAMGLV